MAETKSSLELLPMPEVPASIGTIFLDPCFQVQEPTTPGEAAGLFLGVPQTEVTVPEPTVREEILNVGADLEDFFANFVEVIHENFRIVEDRVVSKLGFEEIDGETLIQADSIVGSRLSIETQISINSRTWATQGIQLDYNSGTPRAYIGDGANQYFQFDGADVFWKGTNTELTKAGAFTATDAYITGTITTTSGTIGGWDIGEFSITSTNIGLHSAGYTEGAEILLGHATLYASAKVGLKANGSGKIADGNFAWDASGNVTGAGTWTNTATITGGVFQTAVSGARVVVDGMNNYLSYFDASNE